MNSWPELQPWTLAQQPAPAAPPAQVNVVGVPEQGGATPGGGTTQAQPAGGAGGTQAPPPGGLGYLMPLMIAMLVVMVLTTMLSGRKEKKKRAELMANLGRQDKVLVAGGIIGTVTEVSDDSVVLRLEEGRMRVAKAAVQQILESSRAKNDALTEPKPEGKTAKV